MEHWSCWLGTNQAILLFPHGLCTLTRSKIKFLNDMCTVFSSAAVHHRCFRIPPSMPGMKMHYLVTQVPNKRIRSKSALHFAELTRMPPACVRSSRLLPSFWHSVDSWFSYGLSLVARFIAGPTGVLAWAARSVAAVLSGGVAPSTDLGGSAVGPGGSPGICGQLRRCCPNI